MPHATPLRRCGRCHASSYTRWRERAKLTSEYTSTNTPTMLTVAPLAPDGTSNSCRTAAAPAPVRRKPSMSRSGSASGDESSADTRIAAGTTAVNSFDPSASARSIGFSTAIPSTSLPARVRSNRSRNARMFTPAIGRLATSSTLS